MLDNKYFTENIILPFFEEIKLRNRLYGLQQYENFVDKKYLTLKKSESLKIIKNNLFTNSISSYILEKPLPSKNELNERIKKLLLVEILFLRKIIEQFDFSLNEEIKDLFVYLVGIQTYMSSYRLEKIAEINVYIDFTVKLINFYKDNINELNEKDKKWFNFLKRCLYLSNHEIGFNIDEDFFEQSISFVKEDIVYSKNISLKEYLFAVSNYLKIYFDHLFVCINTNVNYLKKSEFEFYYNQLISNINKLVTEEKSFFKLYKIFSVIFLKNLYTLKLRLKNKEIIDDKFKIILLIQCAELIKIFYGLSIDHNIFLNSEHPKYSVSHQDALKIFSQQLTIVLNEKNINTLDLLFTIFSYLSNFIEYLKLNTNIYNRIKFVSHTYYYRKIYLLSNILYLKSLKDVEKFKKEILILKNHIESNPIISLITFYNNEIASMTDLPPNLMNYYKADPNVIQIFEKIYYVNKLVFQSISDFKNNYKNDPDFKIKLELLFNIQNEINNILNIVSDPSLIKELGQFYSFFIDNFMNKEGMEYREDYENKATLIKYDILDVNPISFALALIFSKLGKLQFIINHPNPGKLGIRKKMLTQIEKDQIASYISLSSDFLPKSEGMYNWSGIENAIKHLRDHAINGNNIAPPDSRLLKIVSAIINKITRQDIETSKVFLTLLSESYIHTKRIWDLDPILIFYFSTYFSKVGNKSFINENTGKKIEIQFSTLNNSLMFEKINIFLRDLLEFAKLENTNVLLMDDLLTGNEENLSVNKNKKNVGLIDIKNFINYKKVISYEASYISLTDKIYLSDILQNYLTTLGKSFLTVTFKFILSELIDNANKANLKRVFFNDKNLDMNIKYGIAMSNFTETLYSKKADYISKINNLNLKTKISFKIFNDNLIISVILNYRIHNEEIKLIDEAVHRSRTCKNLKDAYKYPAMNTKEGKGFGLIIILLFMRKYELDKRYFKLNIQENETKFNIMIPYTIITQKDEDIIANEITKEINDIPMIPEHIKNLNNKLKDPEVKLEDISQLILTDPSLSADIIRIANSSFYMLTNPVKSVLESIKIIGIKGIGNIISVSTCYKLLENKISQEKVISIFEHSEETAFYAKELTQIFKLNLNQEDIYLASLLHDIGKIIVEGINPDVYTKIQEIFSDKYIPIEVIEDIAGNINHAIIGFLLVKKWNFPPMISEVIRCHHKPRDAKSYPDAVFLVYTANALTYFNSGRLLYENIDYNAIEYFKINNKENLTQIAEQLKNNYKLHATY